ncbi:hypothetical protein LINGRAHAP2_LOCUS20196 [Linum grandiflorum]
MVLIAILMGWQMLKNKSGSGYGNYPFLRR